MKLRNIISYALLTLSVVMSSCSKDEDKSPVIKITGNGQQTKELYVSAGANIDVAIEINTQSPLDRIEVYRRDGIEAQAQKVETFEKRLNQLEGNTFSKTYSVSGIADDVSYSVFAIDEEGNYSTALIHLIMDVQAYKSLMIYDAKADGLTRSFCDTKNGKVLHYKVIEIDLKNLDFGFVYMEGNTDMLAAFISIDEYHKAAMYPQLSGVGSASFRKAVSADYKDAAGLKTLYDGGSEFSAVSGYKSTATKLADGDLVAIKNVHGKYALIEVLKVERASGLDTNNQTLTFNLYVQR